MEYALIIATLAAGGGWLITINKIRGHRATIDRQADTIGGLQRRMQRIADMETPAANATVQRMAAIARNEEYKHRETPNRVRDGYNSRTGRFVGKAKETIGFQGTLEMHHTAPRQGEILGGDA